MVSIDSPDFRLYWLVHELGGHQDAFSSPSAPPYSGDHFQGIFPKRQRQFAEKLGKLVSAELLSFEDIESKITRKENIDKIMPTIEGHIDHFLREGLSKEFPMISMFIGDRTITNLKAVFMKKLEEIFPLPSNRIWVISNRISTLNGL